MQLQQPNMVDESERERLSVMLAVGCIANLALVLCLAHTWKHWRQVSNSDMRYDRNSDVCDAINFDVCDDGTYLAHT